MSILTALEIVLYFVSTLLVTSEEARRNFCQATKRIQVYSTSFHLPTHDGATSPSCLAPRHNAPSKKSPSMTILGAKMAAGTQQFQCESQQPSMSLAGSLLEH